MSHKPPANLKNILCIFTQAQKPPNPLFLQVFKHDLISFHNFLFYATSNSAIKIISPFSYRLFKCALASFFKSLFYLFWFCNRAKIYNLQTINKRRRSWKEIEVAMGEKVKENLWGCNIFHYLMRDFSSTCSTATSSDCAYFPSLWSHRR